MRHSRRLKRVPPSQGPSGETPHSGYGLAALLGAIHYEHDDIELATHYLTGCLDSPEGTECHRPALRGL